MIARSGPIMDSNLFGALTEAGYDEDGYCAGNLYQSNTLDRR